MSLNGNDLGDAVFDAFRSVAQDQDDSDPEATARARWRAGMTALVNYISANATIAPLGITEAQMGTPPHVHIATASTNTETGKIS